MIREIVAETGKLLPTYLLIHASTYLPTYLPTQANVIREIVAETGKEEKDVLSYYDVFLDKYTVSSV